ncbi:MAG: flagellar hook assembly protein FlgD [Gammaproteobacteria bacterium]|nr:flagellar hook assembly protein FlgD [Gammaproteobacteria bacterium]
MSAISNDTSIFQSLGLTGSKVEKTGNELQLEDFLELMVTELTHQDPFKPMENSELASQISQFATVSGIDELNDSFEGLSGSLLSDQSLQAANLVGRDVLVPLNGGYLETGGSIKGVIGLNDPASDVTLSVYDSSGVLVREMNLGTQDQGELQFSWDGLNDFGEFAPAGQYQITASANVNGDETSPYILTQARVDSVSIGAAGQQLALNLEGLGPVAFADVAEIR